MLIVCSSLIHHRIGHSVQNPLLITGNISHLASIHTFLCKRVILTIFMSILIEPRSHERHVIIRDMR